MSNIHINASSSSTGRCVGPAGPDVDEAALHMANSIAQAGQQPGSSVNNVIHNNHFMQRDDAHSRPSAGGSYTDPGHHYTILPATAPPVAPAQSSIGGVEAPILVTAMPMTAVETNTQAK